MNKKYIVIFMVLIFLLILSTTMLSQNGVKIIEQFTNSTYEKNTISGWNVKSFVGFTKYSVVDEDSNSVLRAFADSSASGIFKDVDYKLKDWPYLSWRWKVTQLPRKGDARFKETDDYGARVYVVFPRFLKWKTKTINYIWANKLPKGESAPNTWLPKNAVMIAVQSGTESLGRWITEKRNVYEDYRRIFGEEPPDVGAVAIMSDADNTGGFAEAFYDDLVISKN